MPGEHPEISEAVLAWSNPWCSTLTVFECNRARFKDAPSDLFDAAVHNNCSTAATFFTHLEAVWSSLVADIDTPPVFLSPAHFFVDAVSSGWTVQGVDVD